MARAGRVLAYREPDLHADHPAAVVTVLDPPQYPETQTREERMTCPGCDYVSSSAGIWHHRRRTQHWPAVQARNDDSELFAPAGNGTATRSERTCSECGVRSYFLGREPDWRGWDEAGRCPRCAAAATQEKARMATREEQERMALSCFQSGVLATDQVSKLTGVPFQVCRKVKREGVESGLLARRNVPERPARRRLPTSRKEQGEQRRQDTRPRPGGVPRAGGAGDI